MKKMILLCMGLILFLWGCQGRFQFHEPWRITNPNEKEIPTVRAAMLLPLSGKSASIGEAFQNSAMLALQEQKKSPLEILFFDTKGTSEGVVSAWYEAKAQNPAVIIGPIFAHELSALKNEGPDIPILSFTTDNSLMKSDIYTMGVLIPNQIERLVQFMCESGQKKLAVIGPENKTGELFMNTLVETVKRCPNMEISKISLYNSETPDFDAAVLKIIPPPIDPKKKNLTDKEKELLDTPMAERLSFDSLFIFEDGVKLQQLSALLAYYDVSPKVVPFYGLAHWKTSRDRNLVGGYFASTSNTRLGSFNRRYRSNFGTNPPQIASLAYDAVSLVATLAEHQALALNNLTQESGFNGVNGRFKINSDGTNERLLEVFQITPSLRSKSVSPTPETFPEPNSLFNPPVGESYFPETDSL